jgi:hypothetical protein
MSERERPDLDHVREALREEEKEIVEATEGEEETTSPEEAESDQEADDS